MKNLSGGKGLDRCGVVEGSREVIRIYRPKSVQFKRGTAAVTEREQVGEIRAGMASNFFDNHFIVLRIPAQNAPVVVRISSNRSGKNGKRRFQAPQADLSLGGPHCGARFTRRKIADAACTEKKFLAGMGLRSNRMASTLHFWLPCVLSCLLSL